MIRRLALTVGLAALGAVAFSPKAHGQVATPANEEVTFEGNVGDVCTLTDVEPGILAQDGDLLSAIQMTGVHSVRLQLTVAVPMKYL